MQKTRVKTTICKAVVRACCRSAACLIAVMLLVPSANATENGASVYPVGAETVMPAMLPPPHGTAFDEFTVLCTANQFNNSAGQSAMPEFKLRFFASAIKFVHNWNVPVLGGKFNNDLVIPTIYEQVHIAPGKYTKNGLGNVILGVFLLSYEKKSWRWFYEGDVFFPGAPYVKSDVINTGQNNFAGSLSAGYTYLPHHAAWELSSKLQYIVNFHDVATHYRSGNELTFEYDAMKQISRKVALGVNGYIYKQTTDDMQNGLRFGDGNRGRDLAIGPEARFGLGAHGAFAFKYFHDTMVQNKPSGNAAWFELGIPLSLGRRQ